jgi:hypothetical protein
MQVNTRSQFVVWPLCPLGRKLDGFQSRSECCGEENKSYPCLENNPYSSVVYPVTQPLYRLGYPSPCLRTVIIVCMNICMFVCNAYICVFM